MPESLVLITDVTRPQELEKQSRTREESTKHKNVLRVSGWLSWEGVGTIWGTDFLLCVMTSIGEVSVSPSVQDGAERAKDFHL